MTAGSLGGFASLDPPLQVLPDGLLISRLALPDDEDLPTEVLQCLLVAPVPSDVLGELLHPERDARPGRVGIAAFLVPMPEAAMDEYGEPVPWEDEIRATGEVLPIQTKTEPQTMRNTTNDEFRLGIPPFDPGHHLASPSAVHDVRHHAPSIAGRLAGR